MWWEYTRPIAACKKSFKSAARWVGKVVHGQAPTWRKMPHVKNRRKKEWTVFGVRFRGNWGRIPINPAMSECGAPFRSRAEFAYWDNRFEVEARRAENQ